MKRWSEDALYGQLEARLAVERAEAEAIARAVVIALAEVLSPLAARHVAEVLPTSLASHLAHAQDRIAKRRVLVDRVARNAGARPSSAWEDTIVVCDLLRDALGQELGVVRAALPRDLKILFEDRPAAPSMPRPALTNERADAVPAGQTLSRGKPGPQNPIAEAHADVRGPAQHDSIADHNPHAARKISTAEPGSAETLASGRPR